MRTSTREWRSTYATTKEGIVFLAFVVLGQAANAAILSASYVDGRYTGAESQTLTGYLPNLIDAPNLTQDFSTGTTLDWHSWGAGNGPNTSACCPTTWMVGGAGIGEQSTAFGDINLVFYSTPYTTGNWDWSDGTPTASGDHNHADLDTDAGARWLIHPTTQNPGTGDFIQFSFDGAPSGMVRAATMQLRRDYDLPVKAIQGGQEVVIDSTGGDGLFTVEYNGPDTLYFVIDGSTAPVGQAFVRGFAATLSEAVELPLSSFSSVALTDTVAMEFDSDTDEVYRLQFTTDLAHSGLWQNAGATLAGSGGSMYFFDPTEPTGTSTSKAYRIQASQ